MHVAGTNGKGSVSHMLASVLQASGYKTGLYTSPHLLDFRERIRINGVMIPEEHVVQFVSKYKDEFEKFSPSFFELTVGMCFDYFRSHEVDVAVIETGLGGRLDSTNVIDPLLSVITNIGFDHTDLLGNTLELIAVEKAGIIKHQRPVVIGETQPSTENIFRERAASLESPLVYADVELSWKNFGLTDTGCEGTVSHGDIEWLKDLTCDLGGMYQRNNILTVLCTIMQLRNRDFVIHDDDIRKGLSTVQTSTGLAGRWQVIGKSPLTVCDTGHNKDGIRYVVEQIGRQHAERVHIVIGTVNDKDLNSVLMQLPQNATYYFCNAQLPRALPAAQLKEQALQFGLGGDAYDSVKEAFLAAQRNAKPNDLIFVGGSTFVVAEILAGL
jgi:dihydrofolate synthase/folylpolyglutamate synthase